MEYNITASTKINGEFKNYRKLFQPAVIQDLQV